jgi:hypothetical protein
MVVTPYLLALLALGLAAVFGWAGYHVWQDGDRGGGALFLGASGLGLLMGRLHVGQAARGRRYVQAFRQGSFTTGRILGVRLLDRQHEGNRLAPWRIDYAFEAGQRTYEGCVRTSDGSVSGWRKGQPLYVVYHPSEPAVHSVYPPLEAPALGQLQDAVEAG